MIFRRFILSVVISLLLTLLFNINTSHARKNNVEPIKIYTSNIGKMPYRIDAPGY